jgi:hypothetical protein
MAEPVSFAAPGSTLFVQTPPMLAFDPGSKFTAGLLRQGTAAIDGFTLALGYPDDPDPNAVLDDPERLRAYTDRITELGLTLWDRHFPGQGLRVVVEWTHRPRKGKGGGFRSIPIRDWVIPRMVVAAVTTCFTGCVILAPQGAGGRHKASNGGTGRARDYYPLSLIGVRPRAWEVNEAPRGCRDHEQAAYTLAGLAELASRNRGRHG